MMLGSDINSLETKKIALEIELNTLLKNEEKDEDKINELKSEILHIKKQINKKLGFKEVEKQKEIKKEKSRVDEKIINAYEGIKEKYNKIKKIEVSTKNILRVIDEYLNNEQYQNQEQDNLVKVMSR